MRSRWGKRVKILIDSNVYISAERLGVDEDNHSAQAANFLRLANQLGFQIVIAHATRADLLSAPDKTRNMRTRQLMKYAVLEPTPLPCGLEQQAGFPVRRSRNDELDLNILAALDVGAADWLVTQDGPLRKRARKAGLGDRVFSLEGAIDTFNALLNKPAGFFTVQTAKGYQVDRSAPIFDGIREDYPDYDDWWRAKVSREPRDVLVLGTLNNPEAIAVLKIENDRPHGILGRVLKICTFKVSDDFGGARRGELLLSAIVDYARRNNCSSLYVEVLPAKEALLAWLPDFGFRIREGLETSRHEYVLQKRLVSVDVPTLMDPLDYNIAFGPGAIKLASPHFVPIQSRWHRRLFPEAEQQRTLFPREEPCANALRKVYICRAPIRSLQHGDTLLFLRTASGESSVTTIGVVESTLVTQNPDEIVAFAGNRTVYSIKEITRICWEGQALAIKFRQDRVLKRPWTRTLLEVNQGISGSVQSIQSVKPEGIPWISQQLAAQY